jgi:hypothetical protein
MPWHTHPHMLIVYWTDSDRGWHGEDLYMCSVGNATASETGIDGQTWHHWQGWGQPVPELEPGM